MKKRGFTLIELLVTISIVGILSSMSVAQFQHVKFKAERVKEIAELRQDITKVQLQRVEMKNGVQSTEALEEMMEIEMKLLHDVIILARKKDNKVLRQITGRTCSDCNCRNETFGTPADLIPRGNVGAIGTYECIESWNLVYTAISEAASLDLSFLKKDPWGSPYLIDENEMESQNHNPCRKDDIFSAGPNRTHVVNTSVNPQQAINGYTLNVDNLNDYSVSHPFACGP